jgi:hypothetical protein
MSRKKTSRAGDEPVITAPSDRAGTEAAMDPTTTTTTKSPDADEHSPEGILLQAGARPPEAETETELKPEANADPVATSEANAGPMATSEANAEPEAVFAKQQGSKTLMGFRLDALTMAGLRLRPTPEDKAPEGDSTPMAGDPTPDPQVVEAKVLARTTEDTQVSSLLDEVAQALDVQASEYRDRARGKLPGMSAPPAPAVLGSGDLEFEDPDEPTVLTPGVRSSAENETRNERAPGPGAGDAVDADDEAVVLGPASSHKSPAAGIDNKSTRLPPIPGLSGPTGAGPVGPPPGGTRSATPASGLSLSSSGRVRLPTPAPGSVTIPPPSGRLSLPPGMMSAPVIPGRQASSLSIDSSAIAAAREASRRVAASVRTPGSGRTTKRRTGGLTQPLLDATRTMPAVLAAHVKIATVSLAGLVAVTFAGGLLVGMLVWRGQGRPGADPVVSAAGEATAPASAVGQAAATRRPAGSVLPTTNMGAAGLGAGAAPGMPRPVAGAATEAIVTPIAVEAPDTVPETPPRRAMAAAPRARRPVTTTPTVVDTAALFPKTPVAAKPAAPAVSAAPKTVASNAPAKAAPKSKAKTAWHDPFAD